MAKERLTDRRPLKPEDASDDLVFYVVDKNNKSEHPDGSSFQISLEDLIEILGIRNSPSDLSRFQLRTEKGQGFGYAGLGDDGIIFHSQLPYIAPKPPSGDKVYGMKNGEWVEIQTAPQVINVTGVTVSPSTKSLNYGETQQLTALISPSNATDRTGIWSSSNDNIATVSQSGLVTATGSGNAIITFTTNDGGYHSECSIIASVVKWFVRPSGQTYGNSSGVSYENAWSGLNNIVWGEIGVGHTLAVCGNYNSSFIVQNSNVIIDFNDPNEAAYFDLTGIPSGLIVNGKTGVILNNPRLDNATVQNLIFTDSTVEVNDGDCNNSGNQSFQTMGNSHVTYNNIKSHGNADESISIHDNGTLTLNGIIDFQNNVQAGINFVGTSKLIINGTVNFANNGEADILLSGQNLDRELLQLTINNQNRSDDFGFIKSTAPCTINLNGGTYELEAKEFTLNADKCIINSLVQTSSHVGSILNIHNSTLSNHTSSTSISVGGTFNFKNSRINSYVNGIKYNGDLLAERCLFVNTATGSTIHLIDATTGNVHLNHCVLLNPATGSHTLLLRSGVTSAIINNVTVDGRGVGRGILSQIDTIINNTIIVNTTNSALNGSGATITANNCLLDGNAVDVLGNVIHNNQVFGDPLFSDVANLDYSLSAGSPAIDSGLTTEDLIGILSANWNASLPIISEKTQIAPFDLGAVIT